MFDFSDLVWVTTGLAVGSRATYEIIRHDQVRHKHTWEIVEKERVSGTTLEDAVQVAKASNYAVSMTDIMRHVKPEGFLIHYRCLCGEDRVERI